MPAPGSSRTRSNCGVTASALAEELAARRDKPLRIWCSLAQDEASCVAFGMPREAIAQGEVHEVLSLAQIAPHLLERLRATAGPVDQPALEPIRA